MRRRLALLMFLVYAIPGAVLPLFSLRLQELGFTPVQIGWACATHAFAALTAPWVVGQVADRWYPAERCLAVCALLAAALLWLLADLTAPVAVFGASLAFWLMMVPVMTLGTAMNFAHLAVPGRDFGRVRLWGTIGWMVPGWLLGYWFSNPPWLSAWVMGLRPGSVPSELADAFRLGGGLALLLSFYALTLPHTPPQRRAGSRWAPLAAIQFLRRRDFSVYCLCSFGVCVTLAFTTQMTPLLLEQLGIPRPWLSPTLTIAQTTEVVLLGLLPAMLLHLGVRGTMLLGLGTWGLALALLTLGQPRWLVVSSLALNGLCIACFLVAGQVFVNSQARGDIRVSVQSLLTVVTGLGLVVGNLLVGWVRRQVNGAFPPAFAVGGGDCPGARSHLLGWVC